MNDELLKARELLNATKHTLEKAQTHLAALEAVQAATATPKLPDFKNPFYLLNAAGEVSQEFGIANFLKSLAQGSVFATRNEAQHESRRRVVTKKLRNLATLDGRPNGRFVYNGNPDNYTLVHDCSAGAWTVHAYTWSDPPGATYFATRAGAENALKALGTELDVLRSDT